LCATCSLSKLRGVVTGRDVAAGQITTLNIRLAFLAFLKTPPTKIRRVVHALLLQVLPQHGAKHTKIVPAFFQAPYLCVHSAALGARIAGVRPGRRYRKGHRRNLRLPQRACSPARMIGQGLRPLSRGSEQAPPQRWCALTLAKTLPHIDRRANTANHLPPTQGVTDLFAHAGRVQHICGDCRRRPYHPHRQHREQPPPRPPSPSPHVSANFFKKKRWPAMAPAGEYSARCRGAISRPC